MYQITLFTFKNCKYCNSLKQKLDDNGILYFDFDVEINREDWLEIVKEIGIDIVPTVYIKEVEKDVGVFYVPGRDYYLEDEIFGIIKSYT
jgi:glutaredoxin